MKRLLIPLLLTALTLSLAACSAQEAAPVPSASPSAAATQEQASASPSAEITSNDLKDGVYSAEMSQTYAESEGHGWQDYLTITVSGGKVTEAEYDARMDGKRKSQLTQEEYNMTPHPSKWIPELTENIKKAAAPEDIDMITGATNSSETAKKLYAAVLEAAKTGAAETVVLEK